ncbi:MAG: hypothetical protein IJT78_03075 [Oscillospiraceae bacterium]|nr:hypothetical protein [Oscillospiraceae bacterium]
MRAFEKIKADISEAQDEIELLKLEKEMAEYHTYSDALWKGRRVFIWLLLGAPCALFSIIAAIRYVCGKIDIKPARRFMIISGIVGGVVLFDFAVFLLSNGDHLRKTLSSLLLAAGVPAGDADFIFNMIPFLYLMYLIPLTLMFIFSVVQYKRETKKKNACEQEEAELESKISARQKQVNDLNKELTETKVQAEKLYSEEAAKAQPSRAQMESLAAVGLDTAATWLRKDDIRRGDEIYEQECKKENPDLAAMKKAADLGSPRACLYYGEALTFDGAERTVEEERALHDRAKPYFKTASDNKIPDGELYYIYSRYMSEMFTRDGFKGLLEEARAVKNKALSETAISRCDSLISAIIDAIDRFNGGTTSSSGSSNHTNYSPSALYSRFDPKSYLQHLGLTWYSSDGVQKIKNDPNLTEAQKAEALQYYRIWYD